MALSIKSPFNFELPQPLESDDLEYLVRLLRNGVATHYEKHEIFFGHIRIAINIVGRYAKPYLVDDLLGVAMTSMMEAIVKAESKLTNNQITPYICTCLHGALIDYLNSHNCIGCKKKKKLINYNIDMTIDAKRIHHNFELIDIMEVMTKCIEAEDNLKRREYKKVVLRLRAAGYNNREISEMIEVSENYVWQLMSEIRDYYQKETV